MDNDKRDQMYYADVIAAMAEKTIKRLWITVIVLILVIVTTIGGFLLYLNQYEFETYEYAQDGQGLNVIGTNSLNGVRVNEPETQG